MKISSTLLGLLLSCVIISQHAKAQSAGDYRSNVTTSGNWTTPSTWQVFDGTSWIAATTAPTSADGVITIVTGDSIFLNSATTIDQVKVQNGGILALFNSSTNTTFTLNDQAGEDDIDVHGKLYVASHATLAGTGTVLINNDGNLIVRNSGTVQVSTNNSGTATFGGPTATSGPVFTGVTFTNNGTTNWESQNITLNSSASIVNNNIFNIVHNASFSVNGTTATFLNASGAVINQSASSTSTFSGTVSFTNSGTIKGSGTLTIGTVTANTGTIAPGNVVGALTVNPNLITGKATTLNLEIVTTGAVAGTNYDQLTLSGTSTLTGNTLIVSDLGSADAVGTVYTILTSSAGTINGTFSNVTLSPNLGNLTYTSSSVTVQKLAGALPLKWGEIKAIAQNDKVFVKWSTYDEVNTSHFIVQRSVDGKNFSNLSTIKANGNKTSISNYSFTDNQPQAGAVNYYRIMQADLDGKISYSTIQTVNMKPEVTNAIIASPNPAHDNIKVSVINNNTNIYLNDISGKVVRSWNLNAGVTELSIQGLPNGIYQLVSKDAQTLRTQKIMKF